VTSPTPQDYLDAARASLVAENWAPDLIDRVTSYRAEKPGHVAAVDSAFAAGWRAHAEIVGPCMAESPRFDGCTPMTCELPAGHGGAHVKGSASWIHLDGKPVNDPHRKDEG
jgi:hypothetical protein